MTRQPEGLVPDPSRPPTCAHGHPVTFKPTPDRPGYWTPFASQCTICDGEPAGLSFKPGKRP